jgi:hypothetical protein
LLSAYFKIPECDAMQRGRLVRSRERRRKRTNRPQKYVPQFTKESSF